MQVWHPDAPKTREVPSVVSERQFELIHRPKGWLPWPPEQEQGPQAPEGADAPKESDDE